MNVNTGKRVAIAIGGERVVAGLTEFPDGTAALSFPATKSALRAGDPLHADGRQWVIEKVGVSQFLRGFKLVELRPAESE